MRMLIPALAAGLLLLSACGSEDGPATATDPGSDTPVRPTTVPAAPGPVHTRGLVTVMDTGSPELCLGGVAESYPPQCAGPAIVGWNWADHDGMFERQGKVRWGSFAVTGTFDGETFTYQSAVPAALYDAMVQEPPAYAVPAVQLSEAELAEIAGELADTLPGYQGSGSDAQRVTVSVVYDDGSLQEWLDAEHGKDVVAVESLLVDEA